MPSMIAVVRASGSDPRSQASLPLERSHHRENRLTLPNIPCTSPESSHEPIILIGFSRGAATAHAIASRIQQDYPSIHIDLLISLGMIPEKMEDAGYVDYSTRPANVLKYIQFRSEAGGFTGTVGPFSKTFSELEVDGVDESHIALDTDHGSLDDEIVSPVCLVPETQQDPSRCTVVKNVNGQTSYVPIKRDIKNSVWIIAEQAIRRAVSDAQKQ